MTLILNYIKLIFFRIKLNLFSIFNLLVSWFLIANKYSKMYLNFIIIMFGSILFISLYSLLHIIPFIFLIFSLLILSSFVIGCREFNINFTSSIINLVINRNYSQYLERFILIKFFLFYIYLTSDYSYCASSWLEATHNIFVSLGSKSGLQPKTTVSTLETIGMIAIVGTIGIGSINLYNWSTGNTKRSIDERLNAIEQQLHLNNQNIAAVHTNVQNITQAQDNYAQINANCFITVGNATTMIEENNTNNLNILNEKLDMIFYRTQNIENTLIENKCNMENYIDINIKTSLTSLENKFNTYVNRTNLTDLERVELEAISLEISKLTNNLQNIPQSHIESSLMFTPSSILTPPFKNSIDSKTMKIINNALNKDITQITRRNSTSHIPLAAESKKPEFTSFHNKQTVTFIIENNKIKNMSMDDIPSSTGIATSIIKHTFNNLPTEFILKSISTALVNTLTGSMTMLAFNALLNSFGFGSISSSNTRLALPPTSRSEQFGNNTMTSILDFLRGIGRGIGF